jgi:hypothetical protein
MRGICISLCAEMEVSVYVLQLVSLHARKTVVKWDDGKQDMGM